MRPRPPLITCSRLARLGFLLGVAVAASLSIACLLIAPAYVKHLPEDVRMYAWRIMRDVGPILPLVGMLVVLHHRPSRMAGHAIRPEWWERVGAASEWLLRWLPRVWLAAAVLLLAGWVPHYLRWPWWTDIDHFAVTAQSWDRGILPYRDLLDFNVPGPAYVLWVFGKTLGWGRTWPYYLFDVGLLLTLGVTLPAWSRRRAGGPLPGMIAYVLFLLYYQSLDFSMVAQRDWHAPCFAVLGLLLLEAYPGRNARLASALLFVAALAFRPHTVLFGPAYLSAIDASVRRPGDPWRPLWPALAGWVLAAGAGTLLAFTPILLAEIGDDLATSFLTSAWYGGPYQKSGGPYGLPALFFEVVCWQMGGVLAGLLALAIADREGWGTSGRTWFLALGFLLLYKPLSPVIFAYHHHPLALVSAIGFGVLASFLVQRQGASAAVKVCGLLLLVVAAHPVFPRHWSLARSARAIHQAAIGQPPDRAPLGAAKLIPNRARYGANIYWEDYRDLLDYLRRTTHPETRISNYIRAYPCPPVNGPVGRLTAFPCAEGIQWLRWVAPELEGRFAESLLSYPDAVVVWDPSNDGFPQVEQAIRRHYTPEATFGFLQIWRRRPAGTSLAQANDSRTANVDRVQP